MTSLTRIHRIMAGMLLAAAASIPAAAQNSAPAPGSGGSFNPAPSGSWGGGWGGYNPGPPPPSWGNPWGPSYTGPSTIVINTPVYNSSNTGETRVMACGYDATGVWRTLPLTVQYQWNGAQYDVTVLNAWNPWTDTWNSGVDQPAYNTYYRLNGTYYNFYAPLSTGTYYFNL